MPARFTLLFLTACLALSAVSGRRLDGEPVLGLASLVEDLAQADQQRSAPDAAPRSSRGLLGRKLTAGEVASALSAAKAQARQQRALLQEDAAADTIDVEPLETLFSTELREGLGLPGDLFNGGYYGYYSGGPEPTLGVFEVLRRRLQQAMDMPGMDMAGGHHHMDMMMGGDMGGMYGGYYGYGGHPMMDMLPSLGELDAARRRLLSEDEGAAARLQSVVDELYQDVAEIANTYGVYGGYGYGSYGGPFTFNGDESIAAEDAGWSVDITGL